MDLKLLHSLMKSKGYHYFEGQTNSKDTSLFIMFSTLHDGRGNSVDIAIGEHTCDICIYKRLGYTIEEYLLNSVSEAEVFDHINKHC